MAQYTLTINFVENERESIAKALMAISSKNSESGNIIVLSDENRANQGNKIQANSDDIAELNKSISELKKANSLHKKESEGLKKDNESLKKEKESLEKELKEVREKLEKDKQENANLLQIAQDDLQKKESECLERLNREKEKYSELEKSKELEIKTLKEEINDYERKLEASGILLGKKTGGVKYYNVLGDALKETRDDTAPYIAEVQADGKYKFRFNNEKGPTQEACFNKRDLIITPFCEIIDDAKEDANNIIPIEVGFAHASSSASGVLIIDLKAKISITKI